ncbi:hypothetical protein ABZX88_11950 [Kitasatospora aureofaciens]
MDFVQRTIDLARRNVTVEVYRLWQQRNGGERRVAGTPTAG